MLVLCGALFCTGAVGLSGGIASGVWPAAISRRAVRRRLVATRSGPEASRILLVGGLLVAVAAVIWWKVWCVERLVQLFGRLVAEGGHVTTATGLGRLPGGSGVRMGCNLLVDSPGPRPAHFGATHER